MIEKKINKYNTNEKLSKLINEKVKKYNVNEKLNKLINEKRREQEYPWMMSKSCPIKLDKWRYICIFNQVW